MLDSCRGSKAKLALWLVRFDETGVHGSRDGLVAARTVLNGTQWSGARALVMRDAVSMMPR